ncbi:MAG: DUF465 domain-containing protein [Pacificimonas sp.]|jgi:hypothetical protein|nr:DUF465 domain-containing protein [Pacificimonas sp.]
MQTRLDALLARHRQLDEEIDRKVNRPSAAGATLSGLKRARLHLKDEIHRMRRQLTSAEA